MSATLLACGSNNSDSARRFTAFSEMEPGETYRLDGLGLTAEFQVAQDGSISADPSESVEPRVEVTLDAFGDVTAAELRVPVSPGLNNQVGVSFDTGDGDTFTDGSTIALALTGFVIAESASGDELAVVADPIAQGFDFQSFGVWAEGLNGSSGVAGSASVGNRTLSSRVPDSNLAVYNGSSSGLFLNPDGDLFVAVAGFSASVDFDLMTFSAASIGTTLIDPDSGVASGAPTLNYAGVGTLSADGSLAANIAAVGLTGTMDGALYGPHGEELGAVFDMQGVAGRYIGAVGAAQ